MLLFLLILALLNCTDDFVDRVESPKDTERVSREAVGLSHVLVEFCELKDAFVVLSPKMRLAGESIRGMVIQITRVVVATVSVDRSLLQMLSGLVCRPIHFVGMQSINEVRGVTKEVGATRRKTKVRQQVLYRLFGELESVEEVAMLVACTRKVMGLEAMACSEPCKRAAKPLLHHSAFRPAVASRDCGEGTTLVLVPVLQCNINRRDEHEGSAWIIRFVSYTSLVHIVFSLNSLHNMFHT